MEGKPGSPEKPLSDLGRVSYESYWNERILNLLRTRPDPEVPLSIDAISSRTGMLQSDVRDTLDRLQLIRYEQGDHVLHVSQDLVIKSIAKEVRLVQEAFSSSSDLVGLEQSN